MSVTATWNDPQGFKFNIHYRTRGGFLRACTRSKHASLDNAVDHATCFIIKPSNLQMYREGKEFMCKQTAHPSSAKK